MGNQCCGNQPVKDAGEMAFASAIPVRLTKKVENQSSRFFQIMLSKSDPEPSARNFMNQDRTEEFILTLKPYSQLESPDSISIKLKIKSHDYSYKSDVEWKIDEDVIVDPNSFETSILRVVEKKSGERYSIKVVNFDDYEDYKFKSALYEIYVLQTLQQNTDSADFLVQLKDVYILESEDKDHHKGSLIMLMEYCDSTLHEIIAFRKFHEWKWTDAEISTVFSDLAIALGQMESLSITHRDLRPHNIWYCSQSQRYKIAGFQDAKIVKKSKLNTNPASLGLQNIGIQAPQQDGEDMLNTVRGVPDFLPPEVSIYLESQQPVGKYNPFLLDVYQLGLCIAMMQYLANSFDQQDIRTFIDACKKQKGGDHGSIGGRSYTDLMKMMLCGNEKGRLSPAELALVIGSLNHAKIAINEDNLIKSMKFKKKQVGIEATKIYQLIAVAYYDLFEWEKWHEKMEEIFVTYENNKDDRSQATVLYDIAQGFLEINNVNQAQDYFMKASVLYNEIGHQERKDGQVDDAVANYQQALDCVRKAHNGEDSYEGALMLENLGNVYRLKGDLKKARSYLEEACRIAQQEKGEDSLEAAKVLVHLGKLYTMLADYKVALKKIKLALKITDNFQAANTHQPSFVMSNSMLSTGGMNPQNQSQLLKASALSAFGELQRLKGRLDKAKQTIEEALQIRQGIQGTGHLEVASTLESLGNVYFEMEDYHSAKTYYEKALVIKKSKLGEIHTEVALTLNNIGNACKHLGEQDKAQKFFTDALQILQQVHGNDSHPLIGTTYGNLGILLKEQGNQKGAEHCLTKCTAILQKTMDQDHPDQQFYQDHLTQVQGR